MRRAGRARQQGFGWSLRGPQMLALADAPAFAALAVALLLSSSSAPTTRAPQRSELVELRTESSRTFQNADGTRTTVTSLDATSYRGADGALHAISTRLVPHGSASVINDAAGFRVAFDKRAGEDFVRIDNAGQRVGMTLEGARPAAASVSGSTVRYRGVARNAAIEYESLPRGVKETIVLEGPDAPSSYRFRLSSLGASKLRAQRLGGGAWAITDRGSRFVVEAPWAVDARGVGRNSSGAKLAVTRDGADLVLDVSLDRSWLRARGRIFPVRLDPTITIGPPSWLNFDANCAGCAPYSFYDAKLGTTGTETWRAALRFSLEDVPADARVTDADVRLNWDGACLSGPSGNCGTHTFNAHRVTTGWNSASTGYDGAVLSSVSLSPSSPPGWLAWDVTALARDWHTGAQPNLGVLLKRSSEPGNANGIKPQVFTGQLAVTYALDELTLYGAEDVTQSGATLRWSRYGGTAFAGYEVHRSATTGFTPSASTRLATLAELDDTTYTDTSAAPGTVFYYKVTAGTRVSNELRIALPGPSDPSRTTLQPGPATGQATTIRDPSSAPGACTNLSHQPTIDVGGAGNHGLVRFDLGDIPADSQIASATLSLWRNEQAVGSVYIDASPAGREWRESTTSDCDADGATWTEAFGDVPWTNPGGDIHDGGTTTSIPPNAPPGWQDFDISELVKDWLAGRRANHGVRIVKEGGDLVRFASDDDPYSPALRPKLVITYQDPTPVGIPTAALIAPQAGARVRDTIAVEATAGDDRRVERVEFLLDGAEFSEDATAPYAANWDTRLTTNGSHTLRARAVDDAGNVGLSDPVTVEVANFAPPTVTLTAPPTGYRDTVRADSPAGFWRLGESAGPMAGDNSGNARHGSYGGTYTLPQTGLITGDADTSARLASGSGNVTMFSVFNGLLGPSFTAEAWVKHPGLSVNNTETRVVSRNAGATGGWKLGVRRTSTGAQEAFFNFGSVTAPIAIAPTSTSVYHLVGTYDGTRIRLYVDGREVAQAAATGTANTTANVIIGGTPAADLNVDDVAVYGAALTAEQVKAHYEVGQGRNFWVEGVNDLRATAAAAAGRTLREVQFLVDDQLVAADNAAPYAVGWDTLASGAVVPDGPHVVTARAIDDHDRETTTAPLTVTVGNNKGADKQAQITAVTPLPETLVDETGPWDDDVRVDIKVKNTGTATIATGAAVLRYRFIRPDGTFDDSVSTSYSLGAALAPGAERIISVTVRPPNLPAGLSRSRMTLRFDLRDTAAPQTWWAARGNPPLDHSVLVQREGEIGLGLERYYHYDGEELGGGMTQLVNLASGNNMLRLTPFTSPGRKLSTVVDITYNAQAGEARGSAVGAAWWVSISSLSPFGEPLRCGYGSHYDLKPRTCEELALEGGSDKTGLAMDLVDGDGTVHRFTGRRTAGRTFWRAPQGVHVYLRQLEADEQPACDITENGMQYTGYQSAIRALWAFTRPDGTTFYYQRNGWPTGVADRNGNCIDFELVAPGGDQDRVRVTEVVDPAGVANPAIRSRRAFTLEYYDKGHHHHYGGKDEAPKLKAIRDHTGSKLSFEYYKDDRLVRLRQEGGTTPDGLAAPSREWTMTYTRWWDDDDEETTARIASASARSHPDHNIKDNSNLIYSVRDPRGNETKFDYYGKHPSAGKAARLKRRTNRAGEVTTWSYDTSARSTTMQRPLGRDSTYEFDVEGSLLRSTDKVTATTSETLSVSWTADRHVFKITEPTGQFTEFEYNQNGYVTKTWDQLRRLQELQYENLPVDDDDVAAGWVQAGRTIPHRSQLTKRITARGKQWLFDHHDATGNIMKLTDPAGLATRFEYNGDGTLARIIDGLADDGTATPPKAAGEPDRVTQYTDYDANGIPTRMVNPIGEVMRFCADDDGLLRWTQDPRHAGSPLPADWSQCASHAGRTYRAYFDYDPFHRLVRTSEPKSTDDLPGTLLWTHARYDANDNVTEEFGAHEGTAFRDGAGNRTAVTYDGMDRRLTETLFDFDTRLQDGELHNTEREETTRYTYDGAGRIATLETPRGVSTAAANDYAASYVYDLLDRPLTTSDHGVGASRHTHYCYDAAGDVRSVTRPRAALTSVACGPAGAPAGTPFTERSEYSAAHELKKVTDPSGDATTVTYDDDGNLLETTDAEGAKVNRTYDDRGMLTQLVEDFEVGPPARRLTTKFAYDAVGNTKHVYSPRAVEAAGGNPTPSSDFVTTTDYDGLDRPVRVLLPKRGSEARRYVHRRYDVNGNLSHITVPVTESSLATILADPDETDKWVTRYRHWDPGWIRSSQDMDPRVDFDYFPEGWQKERRPDQRGNQRDTFRTYYRDGQLRTFEDEDGNLVLHNYDRNGNLTFLRDAGVSSTRRPITFDIDHDGFDLVIATIATEEDRHTRHTTFTYNPDGLIETRNDDREETAGGTLVRAARQNRFTYDADGRVTVQEDFGRDASRADDKRITTTYFPTDRERERLVEQWIGSSATGAFEPRQTTRNDYYANGLLRRLRTYGGAGEELRLRESHSLGYRDPDGVFVNGHRTSDAFLRKSPRASVECQNASDDCVQRWRYDGGDRLLEENNGHGGRTSFKLTPAGGIEETRNAETNALRSSATFDGTRMVRFTKGSSDWRLHYDIEGNVNCTTTVAGDESDCNGNSSPQLVEQYTYDYRNRLKALAAPAADRSTNYDHDAIDRVVHEVKEAGSSSSTHDLSYVGSSRALADEEESGTRDVTRSYSYDAFGRRIGMSYQRGSGSQRELTYGQDPHGNVSLLISETGETKGSYGYTAFGETDAALTAEKLPDSDDDPAPDEDINPFRYSGKRTDASSGKIDMGARTFGPEIGQFLQADRFDSALGELDLATDPLTGNRYGLAGGNPVSFIETDGHDPHAVDTHENNGCSTCGGSKKGAQVTSDQGNAGAGLDSDGDPLPGPKPPPRFPDDSNIKQITDPPPPGPRLDSKEALVKEYGHKKVPSDEIDDVLNQYEAESGDTLSRLERLRMATGLRNGQLHEAMEHLGPNPVAAQALGPVMMSHPVGGGARLGGTLLCKTVLCRPLLAETAKSRAARGWKLGDDIWAWTNRGRAPVFATVRKRYWRNRADMPGATLRYGADNVQRMKAGRPPRRWSKKKGDWENAELSHEPRSHAAGGKSIKERWPCSHARVDPDRRPGYC
jgi:RHS repeat-associated protein